MADIIANITKYLEFIMLFGLPLFMLGYILYMYIEFRHYNPIKYH